MSKVYFMIAVICIFLLIFLCVADYALFSYKCALIKRALDFAVDAAAMEVTTSPMDVPGISTEMRDETQKTPSYTNVRIDSGKSQTAFWNTFESNTGILRGAAEENAMIVTTCCTNTGIEYSFKKGASAISGNVDKPEDMESAINSAIASLFPNPVDKQVIKVNGNIKTTQFKERPMFMVFLKNWQINGLFTKREATFIAFKGAKLERPPEQQ